MKPRCYLDHNATSPLRPEARAAMIAAFDCTGNPSSIHGEGRAARQIVENARETVAALFEVEPAAVYFTSGGTEAANWLLQPRGGETLAVCAVEHPCVLSGHRFEIGKSPLILSFSPQARLGELATPRIRIRKRMRRGEGTLETASAVILGSSLPSGRETE